MSNLTLAVSQMACTWNRNDNIAKAEAHVRDAAKQGAGLVLLQELFETPYFCSEQNAEHFDLAAPFESNRLIEHFAALAKELNVVIPVSFFESAGRQFFNSVAMIDATGEVLGVYRKTHIPDGPGYMEKYYFSPGNTGFRVWNTSVGCVGVGICWDQWFPEAARSMALLGADVILYPTAIGSEPQDKSLDSKQHWRRTMQGHAAANMTIVAASNRVGTENVGDEITFYGGSFLTDETGNLVKEMGADERIQLASFDLEKIRKNRIAWGLFRDRRPDQYARICQT